MNNSHRFFKNDACMFFPCHSKPENEDEFNCLFCYCPLYVMGDKCGGNFVYRKTVKVCVDCHLPHTPAYYDYITDTLGKKLEEEFDASFQSKNPAIK